jgi:hypothetical protein
MNITLHHIGLALAGIICIVAIWAAWTSEG